MQRYIIFRDVTFNAYNVLADYVLNETLSQNEQKKNDFMNYCMDDNCQKTLNRILYSIIGTSPSDCQMIDLVHYGNPDAGF